MIFQEHKISAAWLVQTRRVEDCTMPRQACCDCARIRKQELILTTSSVNGKFALQREWRSLFGKVIISGNLSLLSLRNVKRAPNKFICDFEIEFVVEGNSLLCYDLITIEDPLNRDEISYQFCGPRVSDSFLTSESNQLDVIFTSDFRKDSNLKLVMRWL